MLRNFPSDGNLLFPSPYDHTGGRECHQQDKRFKLSMSGFFISKTKHSVDIKAETEFPFPKSVAVVGHYKGFVMPLRTGKKELKNMPARIDV